MIERDCFFCSTVVGYRSDEEQHFIYPIGDKWVCDNCLLSLGEAIRKVECYDNVMQE